MSQEYKKTCKYLNYVEHLLILICKYLNYVEHLLILVSTVAGCVSIDKFVSLVCVPVGLCFCSQNKNLCNHCRNQKA